MLYYCPLESYKERYTMQWSAPNRGWLERNWIKAGIPYRRIDSLSNSPFKPDITIKAGLVLDIAKRTDHCFSQIKRLITMAVAGELTDKDIIYFDDFWHLGIETLPYAFHQLGIAPKMYAFCHAQSVDRYDFTHPMRGWMRNFEIGIGNILTGIFVNSNLLKELLVTAGIGSEKSVHVIGHIFCEEEVRERFPKVRPNRYNRVVFSSRWDNEKNPLFFLNVVAEVLRYRKDIEFVVCTSSDKLRSNNPSLLSALQLALKKYPLNLFLMEGLSKEGYYEQLLKAKVQINTSLQDWVSIALLEASVAGCYPIYPKFRSFPQVFRNNMMYMYSPFTPHAAAAKIVSVMGYPYMWNADSLKARAWIHEQHNSSWARMINVMTGNLKVEAYQR